MGKLILFFMFFAVAPAFAQSMGGGGGIDRPGFKVVSMKKDSVCAGNQWKVSWEQKVSAVNDHPARQFYTCEDHPIQQAHATGQARCEEGGKPQPVTVPLANGRSVLKWEICKNGKYVIIDTE